MPGQNRPLNILMLNGAVGWQGFDKAASMTGLSGVKHVKAEKER